MPITLFCVAAISAVIGFALPQSHSPKGITPVKLSQLVTAAVLLILMALIARWQLHSSAILPGLVAGALAVLAATVLSRATSEPVLALSSACAVSGFLLFQEKLGVDTCALSAVVGSGTVAAALSQKSSILAASSIAAVGLCQLLCNFTGASPGEAMVAPIIVGAITVISVIGLLVAKNLSFARYWPAMACLLGLSIAAAVAKTAFPGASDWLGLLAVPVGAAIVFWMDGPANSPKLTGVLSCLIWIGAVTVAFGIGRNPGIGFALVVSVLMLVGLGHERPILTTGVLLGIVLNRVMRVEHSSIGGALDLGQYYVLIGFLLGLFLPLLPGEWLRSKPRLRSGSSSLGTGIWILICLSGPTLVALFLAPKGLLGFVTGLGLCGAVAASEKDRKLTPLPIAGAVGSVAILEYVVVENLAVISRDEKVHWFILSGVGLAVLAAILGLLGMWQSEEKVALS
jgi:hypothetical protein